MKVNDEKRFLLECAFDGADILSAYSQKTMKGEFFSPNLFSSISDRETVSVKKLYHNNVNLFYGFMSAALMSKASSQLDNIILGKNAQDDMKQCLSFIQDKLYTPSEFEKKLSQCIQKFSALTDPELKDAFNQLLNVEATDILDFPVNQSIYFAKVNHGYWEYMRASYDPAYSERSKFREVGLANKIQRLKTSGLSQMWGALIQRYAISQKQQDSFCRFCISLVNGTSTILETLDSDFTQVSRGAGVGVLSMVEASLPSTQPLIVGDGASTRALINNNCLEDFFDRYIADTEACLFVVPPHLNEINFNRYTGKVHKFIVPPARINETWRAVLASLVGYLQKMTQKYSSISVLVQGASVASVIPMVLSELDILNNTKVRYFDLGRVLDITTPEKLDSQGWSGDRTEEYIKVGRKVFKNKASDAQLVTLL